MCGKTKQKRIICGIYFARKSITGSSFSSSLNKTRDDFLIYGGMGGLFIRNEVGHFEENV